MKNEPAEAASVEPTSKPEKPKADTGKSGRSVSSVTIVSGEWISMPGPVVIWNYKVTVQATIVTPTPPPTWTPVEKKAWLQRDDSGTWTNISPEHEMTLLSGDVYQSVITVPETAAPQTSTLQAVARAKWTTIMSESAETASDHTVGNHA